MTTRPFPPHQPIPDLEIGPLAPKSCRRGVAPLPIASEPFEFELESVSNPDGTSPSEPIPFELQDALELGTDGISGRLDLAIAPRTESSAAHPPECWPTGATPDAVQTCGTAEQLVRSAPYGDPPRHLLETPTYAWLVYRVQTQLRQQIDVTKRHLELAEANRDRVLATWVESLLPRLAEDERFARMLQLLSSEEAKLQTGQGDLARQMSETAQAQHQNDSVLLDLQRQIERATKESQTQADFGADAQRALAREQAKRKRIDIELRGLSPEAADSPAWRQKVAEAEASLGQAGILLEAQRRRIADAARAKESLQLELRRLQDNARLAQRSREQKAQQVHRELTHAEQSVLQHQADIGRAILALRESRYCERHTVQLLLEHDSEVLRHAVALDALAQGLHSFDRAAVKRGLWLSIGTLALGFMLMLHILL